MIHQDARDIARRQVLAEIERRWPSERPMPVMVIEIIRRIPAPAPLIVWQDFVFGLAVGAAAVILALGG